MKKRIVSLFLICLLICPHNIYAAQTSILTKQIDTKLNKCAFYLTNDQKNFTAEENAVDYYNLLDSGYSMDAFKEAFFLSLDDNLKDGKLENKRGKEDAGLYGAVIMILDFYNLNASNYKGVDLITNFKSLSPDLTYGYVTSPYYYKPAVQAAKNHGLDSFAKKMIDYEIKDLYTLGKGVNYPSYCCDSTAMFLATIAPYGTEAEYKPYVEDAIKVLSSYQQTTGAAYTSNYGANADSTALVLLALSAVGSVDDAYVNYYNLVTYYEDSNGTYFWSEDNKGSITISTKDALTALSAFKKALASKPSISYPKTITLSKKAGIYTGKTVKPVITVKDFAGTTLKEGADYSVNYGDCKKIGNKTIKITFMNGYNGQISKKYAIVPKGTSISKLSALKKGFKVTYKKQKTGTKGYEIQYGKKSSLSDGKTAVVTNNTTVSKKITKLQAKKKYYVRVRTYSTVSGKKYYSSWSSVKSVKTK